MQNGEIEQESYIENENDVEKLFDEMLNDNPHIITYAQKALLRCWCRLLLHLQDMVVNREWARYLSELRQMSKVLSLEPGKPKGDSTDLITLLQGVDDD